MKTATKEKFQISNLKIEFHTDVDGLTNDLGKYTDDIENGVIIRQFDEFYEKLTEEQQEEIYSRGREFRAFRPYASGEKPGTDDYYIYGMQDYKRMEGLNKGDWNYLGIIASCAVRVDATDRIQKFTSGGLWGIESDSGDYLKEIAAEQVEDLQHQLRDFGVEANFKIEDFEEVYK